MNRLSKTFLGVSFALFLSLFFLPGQAFADKKASPLNPEILFNLTNDYRIKKGLLPFQKEEKVCEVVKERANEIYNEIFVTGRLHAGFYSKNLPYFATENLIYAQTEERALKWWLNSPIHKAAIIGSSKYSCLECSGNSCSQVFTSYTPKQS